MSEAHAPDIVATLLSLGLVAPNQAVECRPLAGGVSSDILEVVADGRRFCVKRALKRLKVAAHWEAPLDRNAAEAAWFRVVAAWLPDAVPALLGEDRQAGLFAMEFLPPETYPVWKADLHEGRVDRKVATEVGERLGIIHGRSARDPELARGFAHDATFEVIRIEPYLRATARAHPALDGVLNELARRTLDTRLALVHGDVSPKNILCGPAGPVLIDAECACYGDPAFDLAFCLNHLLLKSAYRPSCHAAYLDAFHALAAAYRAHVDWEAPAALEHRTATLLPALLLARIDGKSPVEYLDEAQRSDVRRTAIAMLRSPERDLDALTDAWSRAHG